MTSLQHITGAHRPEMPAAQAIQILMYLLWMLALTPLRPPAMLCGATHPPDFICLGVFPLKMRFSICQEATIIKFSSRSKKDYSLTTFHTTQVLRHGQQPYENGQYHKPQSLEPVPENTALACTSSANAENHYRAPAWMCCHLDLKGHFHFLIAGVLLTDARDHRLGI